MHELALAQDLLNTIQDTIKDSAMKKVTKVRLSLSDPPMLEPDSFEFCFEVVSKDTACEKAKIYFEKGERKGFYLIGLEGDDGD